MDFEPLPYDKGALLYKILNEKSRFFLKKIEASNNFPHPCPPRERRNDSSIGTLEIHYFNLRLC